MADELQVPLVVELPQASKFGIVVPIETPGAGPSKLSPALEPLIESEGSSGFPVTDESSVEPDGDEEEEDAERRSPSQLTPTHRQVNNPFEDVEATPTGPPRISRAMSMPLTSQLGHLRKPSASALTGTGYQELGRELAECAQMVIQTFIQLSPPHILDPAKEQYAGCALSIPTPSVSALLTTMKHLNYMSANLAVLSADEKHDTHTENDFDVAEMLQSVGDALSGLAAQTGVDLVLHHGDAGMRHIDVHGDECGLSFIIMHILRQVLATALVGDSIELELQTQRNPLDASPFLHDEKIIHFRFEIHHHWMPIEGAERDSAPISSNILQRLMAHLQASCTVENDSRKRTYVIALNLERGEPPTPPSPASLEEATHALYSPAQEPSLAELNAFTETLRGKAVAVHASDHSRFAHRLTGFLTSLGLDVSHIGLGEFEEGSGSGSSHGADSGYGSVLGAKNSRTSMDAFTQLEEKTPAAETISPPAQAPSFIIIDDDVAVLRRRVLQHRNSISSLAPNSGNPPRKRPSLAAHHRPRSTHTVKQVQRPASAVILHFTSLSNFKMVKDIVSGSSAEIIVVPKPTGPRRILTALYTAVRKPVVDPIFSPIATSPLSPGSAPRTPAGGPPSMRSVSDRSVPSLPLHVQASQQPQPSPLAAPPESVEYFPRNAIKLGNTNSSGLVLTSPDGQPAGIFFQPRKSSASSGRPGKENSTNRLPLDRIRTLTPRTVAPPKIATPASDKAPSVSVSPSTPRSPPSRRLSPLDPPIRIISTPGGKPSSPLAGTPSTPGTPGRVPKKPVTRRTISPNVPKKATMPIVPPIKVLIVEDNPINQTILLTFMKKRKIKYDVAKNGVEAVEKWKTGEFHLILMDIQMPVMDGIEATTMIRGLEKSNDGILTTPQSEGRSTPSETGTLIASPYRPSVIIVALTASSLQSDRVAALAAGCNDFLTKPVNMMWLESKIIEWGSIKALQMWADLRPEVVKSIVSGQDAQAKNVASRLHVPKRKALKLPATREGQSAPPSVIGRSATAPRADEDTSASEDTSEPLPRSATFDPLQTPSSNERRRDEQSPQKRTSQSSVDSDSTISGAASTPPVAAPTEPVPVPVSGQAALKHYINETKAEAAFDKEAADSQRPSILGRRGISSEGTTITSVMQGAGLSSSPPSSSSTPG